MLYLHQLSWTVLWRPSRPFRTNTQKTRLECKSRKSRNTWSNRQLWPWSTEWSRAKANRVFPGECTGHSKHPLPTTQEKTLHVDITRWSILKSDLIIFFTVKDGEVQHSQQKQDLELTVAQITSCLLQNSGFNWRKYEKPLGHSSMTQIKSFMVI